MPRDILARYVSLCGILSALMSEMKAEEMKLVVYLLGKVKEVK